MLLESGECRPKAERLPGLMDGFRKRKIQVNDDPISPHEKVEEEKKNIQVSSDISAQQNR